MTSAELHTTSKLVTFIGLRDTTRWALTAPPGWQLPAKTLAVVEHLAQAEAQLLQLVAHGEALYFGDVHDGAAVPSEVEGQTARRCLQRSKAAVGDGGCQLAHRALVRGASAIKGVDVDLDESCAPGAWLAARAEWNTERVGDIGGRGARRRRAQRLAPPSSCRNSSSEMT